MFTPNNITELKENEIFVFGSNKAGNHAGGAAKVAVEKFGAIIGQGEGLQGQSYAPPTLDEDMQKVTADELVHAFKNLCECATQHEDKTFYLTKVGCGIAGFTEDEIIEAINKVELPENVIIPEEFNVIYSYKAFDKNMRCRGFQYEVGKEYEEPDAVVCSVGFHACRNPFDVLDYYPLVDGNGNFTRFGEVIQSGKIDSIDNKTCSSKIKIKAEIDFFDFVHTCVEWIKENISFGDGCQVYIGSDSNDEKVVSSDDAFKISSSGSFTRIASSGNDIQIGSSGGVVKIASSGYYSKIASNGHSAQIASCGGESRIMSSGDGARITSSGYDAQIGSCGYNAQIGSCGRSAQIASCGRYAKIASCGSEAKIQSTGKDSVIMCAGYDSVASAKKGSWITLAEWKPNNNKGHFVPVCVKTEYVDGEIIKEDTFYKLVNGEFTEV